MTLTGHDPTRTGRQLRRGPALPRGPRRPLTSLEGGGALIRLYLLELVDLPEVPQPVAA